MDTGLTEFVALPPSPVAELGLVLMETSEAALAARYYLMPTMPLSFGKASRAMF